MILNISGRTDIVAFYEPWLMNRIKEGFFDVRNPYNPNLVSRIYYEDVDMILFCTKNPLPIIKDLKKIKKPILFHVTITPYKEDIEPNVTNKQKIIECIKEISKILGSTNVILRYDPIFLSNKYNLDYHIKAFNKLCTLLDGYVKKVIVSFIDDYQNVRKNQYIIKQIPFNEEDYQVIGTNFSRIAKSHGMSVQTCFEDRDLTEYGFIKGECLSKELAYYMTGNKYSSWKARKGGKCHCVSMVDIGAYNTCKHLCKYCYADYNEESVNSNILKHDEKSSLLYGHLNNEDKIIRRIK